MARWSACARSDYLRPFNPGDALRYNPTTSTAGTSIARAAGEFALYDEYDPRRKITLQGRRGSGRTKDRSAGGVVPELLDHEGVYAPAGTTSQRPAGRPATADLERRQRPHLRRHRQRLAGRRHRARQHVRRLRQRPAQRRRPPRHQPDSCATTSPTPQPELRGPRLRRRRPRRADRQHRRRPADRLGGRVQQLPGAVSRPSAWPPSAARCSRSWRSSCTRWRQRRR
jgi:hypothetical protein